MFIAHRLAGPRKQLKQIIQIENNIVKNPNWQETNQLAICKRSQGFELGVTVKQMCSERDIKQGTAGLRVQRLPLGHAASPFLNHEVFFRENTSLKFYFEYFCYCKFKASIMQLRPHSPRAAAFYNERFFNLLTSLLTSNWFLQRR